MLLTLLVWLFFTGIGTEITREYCHLDDFNITCRNDVIIVTSAFYGRMRIGRCVPYDYEVGCSSNVLEEVGSRCSGREKCYFRVSDSFKVRPCRIDVAPYLEASYKCVPVVRPVYKDFVRHRSLPPQLPQSAYQPNGSYQTSSLKCVSSDFIEDISIQRGYLSGSVAATTGHGTEECPWRIHVSKGQRIKFHFIDFSNIRSGTILYHPNNLQNNSFLPSSLKASLSSSSLSLSSSPSLHSIPSKEQYCQVLAMFHELDPTTQESSGSYPLTSCHLGSSKETGEMKGLRKKLVFTSRTNFVSIHLNSSDIEESAKSLLFHFEVVGCAEPELIGNVVLIRKEGILGVYCNSSGERWHLVCKNGTWVGSYSNCSGISQYQQTLNEEIFLQRKRMSLGLLVAVSVGILVGIISGFVLLLVIFVCRKKSSNKDEGQIVILVHK